jgi:hypothetical protein
MKAVPPKETTMSARSKMLAIASILSLATSLSLAATSSRTAASYAKGLAVTFQQNLGQAPAPVRFIARESAFNLYLNQNESVLQFFPNSDSNGVVLRARLLGSDPKAFVGGEETQQGKVNYLYGGSDPRNITNVPTFARVRYEGVYRGIDLVYYGDQQQLEYDFDVAAGADPASIQMEIAGADQMSIATSGELVLQTGHRTLRWLKPTAYQMIRGKKVIVESSYRVSAKSVGFAIGAYDRTRALVIDPTLVFSTYLGGSGDDGVFPGATVAVDGNGNVYIAGDTNSLDFPTTSGAYQRSFCGNGASQCAFVTKLTSSGALVYSTYFGTGTTVPGSLAGSGAIAVDGSGRAIIAGGTRNVPITSNHLNASPCATNANIGIGFITEFNAAGNGLVYSTYFGSPDGGCNTTNGTSIASVAVSTAGRIYVTGTTYDKALPTKNAAFPQCKPVIDASGNQIDDCADAFFAEVDPSQSGDAALLYSTFLGGTLQDSGLGIAVDSNGNAYLAGDTFSKDFPLGPNPYQSSFAGGETDLWAAKINPAASGSASLVFSTYLGSSNGNQDHFGGLAIDSSHNVYVAGYTDGQDWPTTPGAYQSASPSGICDIQNAQPCWKGVLAKLNATGSALVFSTYLGASDLGGSDRKANSFISDLAVDASHTAFVTGSTDSVNFPTTSDAFHKSCVTGTDGCHDAFLTRFNKAGSGLLYSSYMGGSSTDASTGIALTSTPSAVVVGQTQSSNFPVSSNAVQKTRRGGYDTFVMKFNFASSSGETTCSAPSTTRTIHICSPTNGSTVSSPVKISATAKPGPSAIKVMQVYIDGVKKYEKTSTNTISTTLSMGTGAHRVTVQAQDSAGFFRSTVNITVH